MAKKKADRPLFGIWLDERRLGGAWPIDEAIALLGACTRRWERENEKAATQIGVRSADGGKALLVARSLGYPVGPTDGRSYPAPRSRANPPA